MQNLVPIPPAERTPVPAFAPVPRRYRHDGWTAARQRAFVDALAELGSVKHAAKRINMSAEGAYCLRRQPGAEGFRAAWDAALDFGVQRLTDIAIERATEGVAVPIFWQGQQVGEKRWYNDRLLMFVLRHHRPERYGALLPVGNGTRAADAAALARAAEQAAEQAAREAQEAEDARAERVALTLEQRLHAIRLRFKKGIATDPAKRAAWELLVGPTDWDGLDGQPVSDDIADYNMNRPDMILPLADESEE